MKPFSLYLQLKVLKTIGEEDRRIAGIVCDHSTPNTYREPQWTEALDSYEWLMRNQLDQTIENAAGIDQGLHDQLVDARRILLLPTDDLHARNCRRVGVGIVIDKTLSAVEAML